MREEVNRLGNSFCTRFWYINAVALVMVWGYAHYYLAARRHKRSFIVVENSLEYFIQQEFWIYARWAQEVQCCDRQRC